jgi:DMSO/TMAO reductase YedYZ heme-binding membrane subunit
MNLAWYVARAGGIVAWLLVTAAVVWGLLLSIRLTRRPTPRWLLDLHRFLGGLAVTFTALHVCAVVADNFVHFGLSDVLLPFASRWRPGAVALGVVGLWLLAAIEVTSLLMSRLPRRLWRAVHLSSYVLFWVATIHGLTAGTDARHPAYVIAANVAVAVVVFLTLVRVLSPRPPRSMSVRSKPATKTSTSGQADRSAVIPMVSTPS